jgi:PAS domain S-box-containing protein
MNLDGRLVANCVWEDVTDKKAAEAAVIESERRATERETLFRTLFETIPLSAALIDLETEQFLQFNDAAAKHLGYTPQEFAKLTVFDIEGALQPQEVRQRVIEDHRLRDSAMLETKHRTKSGALRDVVVYDHLLTLDGRRVSNCVWQDVTEKKAAEAALRESERRFRSTFENAAVGFAHVALEGRYINLNQRFCEIVGYPREELLGKTWQEITHPEDLAADLDQYFKLRDRLITSYQMEKRYIRQDGTVVWANMTVSLQWNESERPDYYIAVIENITNRKLAEAALIRSEKLVSVGRMAATLAHEINNPLAAVTNCVYLVRNAPDLPLKFRGHLETADRELRRVAHIAKRTLGFYRETAKPAVVDLRTLVDEVVELYDPKFTRKDIRLEVEHKRDCQEIIAIAGEIRQVISNLLTNAFDASQPTDMVRVRTSRVTLNGCSYTRVTVADTGTGISAANRNRIFEPFFTTKKAVGTGLGLWVSREIIQKHNGRIRVRSFEGRGAVFSIFLPSPDAGDRA